jgi:hypothetical protein
MFLDNRLFFIVTLIWCFLLILKHEVFIVSTILFKKTLCNFSTW